MEYASEKTILSVREIDPSYTIPKKREENVQKESIDQTSVVNDPLYSFPENVRNYLIARQQNGQALKRPHEDKKPIGPIYRDSYAPDLSDETLPDELRVQFQPLFCKLCSAQLSSTVVAKLHYNSKNHDKKVKRFLFEYSLKTGEPLHKRANVIKKPEIHDDDTNPKYFHCDICDLPLTGKLHAESHYMGKNHHKALMGKAPAGKGFFNPNGQWIRTQHIKTDLDRDNFGIDFNDKSITNEKKEQTNVGGKFTCEICQVNVTSQGQLDMHIAGQKHKKKVNSISLLAEPSPNEVEGAGDSKGVCYSKYRTPSGSYYCKICNISVNSEIQFKQHLGSKKHLKKNAANPEMN